MNRHRIQDLLVNDFNHHFAYGKNFPLISREGGSSIGETTGMKDVLESQHHTITRWIWFLVDFNLAIDEGHNSVSKLEIQGSCSIRFDFGKWASYLFMNDGLQRNKTWFSI